VVWLTVPVTWSPAAVGALETAATRAGFGQRTIGKLELATEADAAIHHVVHSLGNRFEVNEGVLVCDVGGGTTVGSLPYPRTLRPVLSLL
jgi:molecular chaperone DnaK (HSP70)